MIYMFGLQSSCFSKQYQVLNICSPQKKVKQGPLCKGGPTLQDDLFWMPRSHHCAFLFPDVVESCSAVKWQEYSTQQLPDQNMCCLTAMRGKQYYKISAVRLLVAVLVRCMLCTACCFLFSSLVIKNIQQIQLQQLLPYLWYLQPLRSHRCSYGALELRRLFEALPVPGPFPHKDLQDLDQHRPGGATIAQ